MKTGWCEIFSVIADSCEGSRICALGLATYQPVTSVENDSAAFNQSIMNNLYECCLKF